MKILSSLLILTSLALTSCSPSQSAVANDKPTSEGNLTPNELAGTTLSPDSSQGFQVKVVYVRNNPQLTRAGATPVALTLGQHLEAGDAVTTPDKGDAELYVQTPAFSDGVVRISDQSWVVIARDSRPDRPELTVFIYGGKLSFFIPPSHQNVINIMTPAGRFVSQGGMFNVTVTPAEQVLVASREGTVVLEGAMFAAASPGRALALDRPGSWTYPVPASDVSTLQDRWLEVMTDDSIASLHAEVPQRTWKLAQFQSATAVTAFSEQELTELVVWAWQAKQLLGAADAQKLPSVSVLANLWSRASVIRSQNQGVVWPYRASHVSPSLLGFTP